MQDENVGMLPSADSSLEVAHSSVREATRRIKHRKVRTGCLRCKQRRVRCDEHKPECQRCIKINVPCPGYNVPQTRIFGLHQAECFKSDFDRLCFDSFIKNGINDLSDFQPSSTNFWQVLVPQLGQVHSAVRQAVIAVAVMQEPMVRFEAKRAFEDSLQDLRAIALDHFNDSIRSFVQNSTGFGIEVRLTCCSLYHMLTKTLENMPAGGTHVRAADFFLKDHERAVADRSILFDPVIAIDFAPMIQQNILDASTFVDGFQTKNSDCGNRFSLFRQFLSQMPSSIVTIGKTYETLAILVKYSIGHHLQDFSDLALISSLREALECFQSLIDRSKFPPENFESAEPSSNPNQGLQLRDVSYFRAHHAAAYVFAHTIRGQDHQFDSLLQQFADIVSSCEVVLTQNNEELWSVCLGIIPPLFLVATKCREKTLRTRALKALHCVQRVENTWSSCIAATIANFVIDQEAAFEMQSSRLNGNSRSLISLQKITLAADNKHIYLSYIIHSNSGVLHMARTLLSFKTANTPRGFISGKSMQDRVLWAAGYCGLITQRPRISCHCDIAFRGLGDLRANTKNQVAYSEAQG